MAETYQSKTGMPSPKPKAILSWSSGKDSAYSLFMALKESPFEIVALLTTVTDPFQRVSMHGVREKLLESQAQAIGLPLHKIRIPSPCPNEIYEAKMIEYVKAHLKNGVAHFIFGDLFLEDIRQYREQRLSPLGIKCVFPLWLQDTRALAHKMIRDGFEAILTCVDLKKLPKEFAGRKFDQKLLNDLPKGIDPCGENGEFHSFVYGGPIFKESIPIQLGETVEREGFAFADILPS